MALGGLRVLLLLISCFVCTLSHTQISLNGEWIAKSSNGSIVVSSTVPGSIYTDLIKNGTLKDPYYRFNDEEYRWVAKDDWTFTRTFTVTSPMLKASSIKLVCDGLDTVASVYVNNQKVGESINMFVKYKFDIKHTLKAGPNEVKLVYQSPVKYASDMASKHWEYKVPPECPPEVQHGECHVNFIRKEQCSFSWDWGPAFPTIGIWKNISVEISNSVVIEAVMVETKPVGDYSSWMLSVNTFFDLYGSGKYPGVLEIRVPEVGLVQKLSTTVGGGVKNITATLKIDKGKVKTWWPNGHGEQPLYYVEVLFTSQTTSELTAKRVRVGFRTVELIQDKIPNASGLSFYFKINGKPIFMKGSNWIPADSFQERLTPKYLRSLLTSAQAVHMNMLRVWGGGIYESETFYSLADELGILIWQDFMFACALYPVDEYFLDSIQTEVTHQVLRLQHHPSVALWSGNNENEWGLMTDWYNITDFKRYKADYVTLYIDNIMNITQKLDRTRPFIPSSPSNGIETQQEGWVAKQPQDVHFGDIHHYDYGTKSWEWNHYQIPRFCSEYGFEAWPSFENLEKVSVTEDWNYNSEFCDHRQHHGDGNKQMVTQLGYYLNLPSNPDPVQQFKDYIYLTQINQAMSIKTETELFRRSQSTVVNGVGMTMGALYWQLQDIWQAPSWASIEYGGKWKMLHYYARHFFSPVLVSPYIDGAVLKVVLVVDTLSSGRALQKSGNTLYIQCYSWDNLKPLYTWTQKVDAPKVAASQIFQANVTAMLKTAKCSSLQHCVFFFFLNDVHTEVRNWVLPVPLKTAVGMKKPNVTISTVTQKDSQTYQIKLTTAAVAPFVWLEANGILGRFSDNSFLMVQSTTNIVFYAWETTDLNSLKKALTVRSLMDVYK
ncbi:beta-mannosidase isoform X2 [Lingula anatina]|uniref:Beta-mannosidase n=1 Tax=Lingula anatina TaxID=7574 RepID=A0A1S3HKP6_LINAN|nr:beta-mannosidase isoform X2 [Lingula anatina]|eukprot:XP_013386685.1 beta-mannosidase isoform X2 [Lingula anatina]